LSQREREGEKEIEGCEARLASPLAVWHIPELSTSQTGPVHAARFTKKTGSATAHAARSTQNSPNKRPAHTLETDRIRGRFTRAGDQMSARFTRAGGGEWPVHTKQVSNSWPVDTRKGPIECPVHTRRGAYFRISDRFTRAGVN